ncbi:MAG: hypothetical protein VR64_08345 [Desulfatitalea sp. BRH_c12]|nr:MAG: hypothetical protein VR64_08345 [Desulfatitalea sp. BRH_c12]
MNIGIESSSLINSNPSGIIRYVKELIGALLQSLDASDELRLYYKLSRWKNRDLSLNPALSSHIYYKSVWPLIKKVDLIHIPDSTIVKWPRIKRVITIHDLFVLLTDNDAIARKQFRVKKRKIYEQMIDNADAILAVSEATKKDILTLFKVPEEKIHITSLGADHNRKQMDDIECKRILKGYGLAPGYLLFLGAISGRKNTERLVRAFNASKASRERKLVLAGPVSYKGENTLAAISDCGLHDKIVITGYLPEKHLPAIYIGASAFLFPTLYEGFGIPILEAMGYGLPVLTSTTGSAPEISAGHALCVDPYDVGAIAAGIDQVLETDALKRDQARKHSRLFTWKRCAEQTMSVYRQLV